MTKGSACSEQVFAIYDTFSHFLCFFTRDINFFFKKNLSPRKYLQEKRLCFNCTGLHRATNCRSRGNCANCNQRHHTSTCDRNNQPTNEGAALTAAHVGEKVCYPVVVVKVNGVKCRAFRLLDTRSTGTYISASLVDLLKVKPALTLTVVSRRS